MHSPSNSTFLGSNHTFVETPKTCKTVITVYSTGGFLNNVRSFTFLKVLSLDIGRQDVAVGLFADFLDGTRDLDEFGALGVKHGEKAKYLIPRCQTALLQVEGSWASEAMWETPSYSIGKWLQVNFKGNQSSQMVNFVFMGTSTFSFKPYVFDIHSSFLMLMSLDHEWFV